MKEAIQKAIEGGYTAQHYTDFEHYGGFRVHTGEHFALDPLFWSALGKAMGWAESDEDINQYQFSYEGLRTWKWHWLSFTLHLAEGKDADSFFNELLK